MQTAIRRAAVAAGSLATFVLGFGIAWAEDCGWNMTNEKFAQPDGDECVKFCLHRIGTTQSSVNSPATVVGDGARYWDGQYWETIPLDQETQPNPTFSSEQLGNLWVSHQCWTYCWAEEGEPPHSVTLTVSFPNPCGGEPPTIQTGDTYSY